MVHGSPDIALDRLLEVQSVYHADEIFVVTAIDSFKKRLRSYELLGDIYRKAAAQW